MTPASPPLHLIEIFDAALAAADPYHAVRKAIRIERDTLHAGGEDYELPAYERMLVIGAGKATARMALAVESLLGGRITEGSIVVKYGHTASLKHIEQAEASHPLPDAAGIAATQRILELAHRADEKTLVLCLLSGGASALLTAPADGLALADKQQTTRLLLNAGASISELNTVRKHLSAVKGGQLARALHPARSLVLVVSDVIGDRLDVIASGPASPDDTTFADAWAVITKYGLQDKLPARVAGHLRRGIAGLAPETVKAGDPCLGRTHHIIVASLHQALAAAAERAAQLGHTPAIVTETLQGQAREAARLIALRVREELSAMRHGERRCLLYGGETTVTVYGTGKGGRNQELALACALEIDGIEGVTLLAAGTDGTDGPTDAAGAIVSGSTAQLARKAGLNARHHLDNNDSFTFFQRLDTATGTHHHFKTGPTGTNVTDLQIVLLDKAGSLPWRTG